MSNKSIMGLKVHPETEKFLESVGLRFLFQSDPGVSDNSKASEKNIEDNGIRHKVKRDDWSTSAFGCGSRPEPDSIGKIVEHDISRICTERSRTQLSETSKVKQKNSEVPGSQTPRIPDYYIPQHNTPRREYVGATWLNNRTGHLHLSRQSSPRYSDVQFLSSQPETIRESNGSSRTLSPRDDGTHSRGWTAGPKPPMASVSLERASKSPPIWDEVIMFGGENRALTSAPVKGNVAGTVTKGPSLPAAGGGNGFAGTM
jgi:hypothetical protein